MARRLRVLAGHPVLGEPNEIRTEFPDAQAYVDAGYAEWIVDRSAQVETTDRAGATEAAVMRPSGRKRATDQVVAGGNPATETR